jgi:hypothetical protein
MITNQVTIAHYAECYSNTGNTRYLSDIEYLLNEYQWQSFQRGF